VEAPAKTKLTPELGKARVKVKGLREMVG